MTRRTFLPRLMIVLALLGGIPASGRATAFGFNELRCGSMEIQFNSPTKRLSLWFVPPVETAGKSLSKVKFYVRKVLGGSVRLRVEIREDAGGTPAGGVPVASGSVQPLYSYSSVSVSFSASSVLTAGRRYHVLIYPDEGGGVPSSTNYAYVTYGLERYRTNMGVLLDFGSGWYAHPFADPSLILVFSDGTEWGQPYYGWLGAFLIYGSGSNWKAGQRFVAPDNPEHSPFLAKKVSLCVTRNGNPPSNLRVGIIEDASPFNVVIEEDFCNPQETSPWKQYWQSHVFSSPVSLEAGKAYRLYLVTGGGQGDSSNCYAAGWMAHYSSQLSFGGSTCWAFTEDNVSHQVTDYKDNKYGMRTVYFKFDTNTVELVRLTPHLVTDSSVTVVAESNVTTDAVLEYGTTADYGSSALSTGKTTHRFDLSGLAAGTEYHYRVILANPSDLTDTFTTEDCALRTNSESNTVGVTVIGDTQSLGYDYMMGAAGTYPHDLTITTGDNTDFENAPPGPLTDDFATRQWEWYLSSVTPITKNSVFYTTLGNHDYSYVPTTAIGVYKRLLIMPANGAEERYYSFDYGPAHFVVLDTGDWSVNRVDDAQLAWLQSDLGATTKPWKIVFSHLPVQGISPYDDSGWRLRNWSAVHDLFRNVGVSLVVQGHRHVYNRYCKDGVFYLINSTATMGNMSFQPDGYEQGNSGMPSYANAGGDTGTIPAYISKPGWVQLQISAATVHADFIDSLGRTLDSFSLPYVPPPLPPPPPASIGEVKQMALGEFATVVGVITSGTQDGLGRIYIEDENRAGGMWIICQPAEQLDRGGKLTAEGTVTIQDGEYALNATKITQTGSSPVPRPVCMNFSHLGGSPIGLEWPIQGGLGLNNIGLLVKVAGVVRSVSNPDKVFYLDDGSQTYADNGSRGIKILAPQGVNLPQSGQWVSVTGISSCQLQSSNYYRVVRPRDAQDILPLTSN